MSPTLGVVPAKAGTHSPSGGCLAAREPKETLSPAELVLLRRMGPLAKAELSPDLRGDDLSGGVLP